MTVMEPNIRTLFREAGLAGRDLMDELSDVVSRPAGPVLVTGPHGSGRSSVARVVHRILSHGSGRLMELPRERVAALGDGREVDRVLGLAAGGTLVLDGVDAMALRAQTALARHIGGEADPAVVLVSSHRGSALRRRGLLSSELAERIGHEVALKPLYSRGRDIQDLAAHFLAEHARELCPGLTPRFTRRALSDLRQGMQARRIGTVQRLKELVREALEAWLASGAEGSRIASSHLPAELLERGHGSPRERQAGADLHEMEAHCVAGALDEAMVREIAARRGLDERTLLAMCRVTEDLLEDADGNRLSYAQVTARMKEISRLSLWLVSGATSQVEFRRFFGKERWRMPTKSVAWAIYHEVFPEGEEGS